MRYSILVILCLSICCSDKYYITEPAINQSPYEDIQPGTWFDFEYELDTSYAGYWKLIGYKMMHDDGRLEYCRWIEPAWEYKEASSGSIVKLRDRPYWDCEVIDTLDVSWYYDQ